MGLIAEKLRLEHFSREAFLRLLDYVIDEIKPYRLIAAGKKPDVKEQVEINPGCVFDIPLAGTKHMIYGNGKTLDELRMVPGEAFCCAPLTWKRPLWDCAHEMTSFVYNEQFVRITYVDIPEPPAPGMYPRSNCFYHTQRPQSEAMKKLLDALILLGAEKDPENASIDIMSGLFRLTRKMLSDDHAPDFSQSQLNYQRIQQYLRDNFQANINRNHVAHEFSFHPGYVSRLYLENGGRSFSETLHALRMEHAAILLKNTNLQIKEITENCGYESLTFFTSAFKKYYGLPPGRFRQQFQKDKFNDQNQTGRN